MHYTSISLFAMQHLAQQLALVLQPKDVITLSGDLGSGKTTFARAVIQALSQATEVTSPTFNLMQSYDITFKDGRKDTLWHLDLYRLKQRAEAYELGLEELWKHCVLIEWAEIVMDWIPPENHLDITFDFGDTQECRTLVLKGSASWQQRLELFKLEPFTQ